MKEVFRFALFPGLFLFLSIARAVAADVTEPTQEHTKNPSTFPSAFLGFEFEKSNPQTTSLAGAGSSSLPPEDLGEIVRLPKFVVEAPRNVPQEKEMLTSYGRLQFAKNRFTSPVYRATFGPLSQVAAYYFNFLTILNGWHPSDAEAMALYRESERVQILTDFDGLCRLDEPRDPLKVEELRRMRVGIRRTGIDSLYWGTSAGPSGIHIGRGKR